MLGYLEISFKIDGKYNGDFWDFTKSEIYFGKHVWKIDYDAENADK